MKSAKNVGRGSPESKSAQKIDCSAKEQQMLKSSPLKVDGFNALKINQIAPKQRFAAPQRLKQFHLTSKPDGRLPGKPQDKSLQA